MVMTAAPAVTVEPWRLFRVRVARVARLSPTFVRVTFTAADLGDFADNGYDQRVTLLLPDASGGFAHLPTGPDWYATWQTLPDERRNPVRTYTVRAVRAALREVDVDLTLHGATGPASAWAAAAQVGDEAALLGPDGRHDGDHNVVEWRPPTGVPLLLAGDETAVPAVLAILERLPRDARGVALLEVPDPADDALGHDAPPGVEVRWLPRGGPGRRGTVRHGVLLVPAVEAAVLRLRRRPYAGAGPAQPVAPVDVDREVLWEVPEPRAEGTGDGVHVWLAGETGMVAHLRRLLVTGHGLDRASIAFMGYWRLGRSEAA